MEPNIITEPIDFSVKALFPNHPEADSDPRCTVISQLFQEFNYRGTQVDAINAAQRRYEFLLNPDRLSLPLADDGAFQLYRKGVSIKTAQAYYSFRLSDQDAAKWQVLLV